MILSDFTKQPRGPYSFDAWIANQVIPSSMGEFTLQLQTSLRDNSPPNEEMVRLAEQLAASFRAEVEIIHDKVFEHYQMAAQQDPEFVEDNGVPADLDRAGILGHLQERTLLVTRIDHGDEPYHCRVCIVPEWDEEHAIYISHDSGQWEFADY